MDKTIESLKRKRTEIDAQIYNVWRTCFQFWRDEFERHLRKIFNRRVRNVQDNGYFIIELSDTFEITSRAEIYNNRFTPTPTSIHFATIYSNTHFSFKDQLLSWTQIEELMPLKPFLQTYLEKLQMIRDYPPPDLSFVHRASVRLILGTWKSSDFSILGKDVVILICKMVLWS